jgi:putative ABC transport system substrate-binding protein
MSFDRLRRRDFVTLLSGVAANWPLAARAQQPALPVIGVLASGSAEGDAGTLAAIRQDFGETGYIEGRNRGRVDAGRGRQSPGRTSC